jgi:TPR repeat protein
MRCLDCRHRFMVPVTTERKTQVVAALAVAGAIGILMVVVLSLLMDERPAAVAEAPARDVSVTVSAEAMAAAEKGSPEAQFAVASSLLADSELNQAYSTKALELLERAAKHGHKRAMLRLGLLYRKGIGALQNYTLAAKWIGSAAGQGEPQAMLEMGRLYREGIGVKKDLICAYQWFNRAAAAHETDAVREREEVARLLTAEELRRAQNDNLDTKANVPAAAPAGGLKTASGTAEPH